MQLKSLAFGFLLLSHVCLAQSHITITDTISASLDDTYERGTGISDRGCLNVFVKSYTDTTAWGYISGGFRFDNLTVPQGATINAASFKGFVKTEGEINCRIYGNDVDSAHNFLVPPHVIRRDRTETYVAWVEALSTWAWHTKRGLEGIIQEIVDRPGWKSGNSIALLFIANSDEERTCAFQAWDDYTSNDAQLTITYVWTGIDEEIVPFTSIAFTISQNHPNPFTDRTTIEYAVPRTEEKDNWLSTDYHLALTLKVYDHVGRLIRTLVDEPHKPGSYRVIWDGTDDSGNRVAPAVYFYRLMTADCSFTKKMMLVR